ncbi:hypothetical protein FQN54_005217 [Arachnomyces sp. PD_36]|nr:hypothetical protein FQN54_005217 [Arachnomyces sp. PD_36]
MPSRKGKMRSRKSAPDIGRVHTAPSNPFIDQSDGSGRDGDGDNDGAVELQHQPPPRSLVPLHSAPQLHQVPQSERSLHPSHALRAARGIPVPSRIPSPRPRFPIGFAPRRERGHVYSRARDFSSEAESQEGGEGSANPFGSSGLSSRVGSDDEDLNTQTVARKYSILPAGDLLLFPEDVEPDDYLHNPSPDDNDDSCWGILWGRFMPAVAGVLLVMVGASAVLGMYPLVREVRNYIEDSKLDPSCDGPPCIVGHPDVPLLQNIRTGLIDPDTPDSAKSITAANGKEWELVFSDEFNQDDRSFYDGDDPFFQAVDIWYGVTQDLEWYDPDAVTTKGGVLEITFDEHTNHALRYRSGMVQSWNKLCFKGGRVEASISLPGRGDTSGFWPGFWTMGNLGRPGYAASTEGIWPYSYDDVCDAGITANQSSTDGISFLPGMRLPACTCSDEDHPTPGKSRSAPEIDVIEASVTTLDAEKGVVVGDVSQSAQIAPFDVFYTPNYNFAELYDPRITTINAWRGGPYQQAVSALTNVNNRWYDGKEYQVYAYEYTPGAEGEIIWFVGKNKTWKVDARALGPNGNVGQRVIPVEPMSIIMNFGMSKGFSEVNLTGILPLLPAVMRFDYIRIYQDPDEKSVTCDPEGWETTEYIREHKEAYTNPNLTTWADTPFEWPRNEFVHGC